MATQHQTQADGSSTVSQPTAGTSSVWYPPSSATRVPRDSSASTQTFQMTSSPVKARRAGEGYKPKVVRTCGSRPAYLVNASVTYCGDNQIYAFGGFDQYTDEGTMN
jgi:hypothetical protein